MLPKIFEYDPIPPFPPVAGELFPPPPAAPAPPPPPVDEPVGVDPDPPSLPCAGLVGGVLPSPLNAAGSPG